LVWPASRRMLIARFRRLGHHLRAVVGVDLGSVNWSMKLVLDVPVLADPGSELLRLGVSVVRSASMMPVLEWGLGVGVMCAVSVKANTTRARCAPCDLRKR